MIQEDKKQKDLEDALSDLVQPYQEDEIEVPMDYDGDTEIIIRNEHPYTLVMNYRDGFVFDEFHRLYQDYFEKYDYIVGDWAHDKLRLRGFFQVSQRNVPKDRTIDFLDDYLKEYCNFGCAYFVLAKDQSLLEFDKAYQKYQSYISKPKKIKGEKVFSTRDRRKKRKQNSTHQNVRSHNKSKKNGSQQNFSNSHQSQSKKENFQINTKHSKDDVKESSKSSASTKSNSKSFVIKKKED